MRLIPFILPTLIYLLSFAFWILLFFLSSSSLILRRFDRFYLIAELMIANGARAPSKRSQHNNIQIN